MKGKTIITRALSARVLAVAVINEGIRDWSAYIDAVPGQNHETEKGIVIRTGEKLPKEIAEYLFPYAKNFRWRD